MFVVVMALIGAVFLAFLPEVGLSHSAQPPVLVGLLLITFLTESYGWVFTGLIVPGYLAPIFVSQPWSGAVIVVEAIVTYLIVRGLSDYMSRFGLWADFFGRDGFFAHLIVSVVVRLVFEVLIFPELGQVLVVRFGVNFDYRNTLYSIGLVAVPLLSNMMWKPGLRRGLFLTSIPIVITFLVTQYLLIPYTNFSVARFDLLYEDVAVDFASSGSHYIIFLFGTIFASRTNLAYGWDYGGIVVPGLLALVWNTPLKIFTTFFEAFVIVAAGRFIVSRKIFESVTIEGPRKTLLIFVIGFSWKWVVSWIAPYVLPEFRPTELYGFGYLLPTIIAGKIWAKNSLALVVMPAIRTSFLAFVLGIAVSIGFASLLPASGKAGTVATAGNVIAEQRASVYNTLVVDRGRIIPRQARRGFQRPYADELDRFDRAIELVLEGIETKERATLERAAAILSRLNYETLELVDDETGDRYLYLREAATDVSELNGWGIYVFNMNPTNDVVFEVPRPREEWKTLDTGEILFREFNGRALLVAGAHYLSLGNRGSDVTRSPRTVYHIVHRRLRFGSVVQVRGQKETKSELWIKGEFPHEALNLTRLREIVGDVPMVWRENAGNDPDIQRSSSTKSFITFNASLETRRRALARRYVARDIVDAEPKRVSGYLRDWFATEKNAIAGKGTGAYQPPTFSDLLFTDEELIAPILASQSKYGNGYPEDELRILATAAAQVGYELIEYTYVVSGDKYLVLRELPTPPDVVRQDIRKKRRFWGTFVFKLGESDPLLISVPRPLSEKNTLDAGVQFFEYLNARALVIAGAHERANLDGKSDILSPDNVQSVFTLIQQALLRESLGGRPVVFGQIRGFNPTAARLRGGKTVAELADVGTVVAPVDESAVKTEQQAVEQNRTDIVLSTGRELADQRQIPEPLVTLESEFRNLGFTVDYFDGTVDNIRFAERGNLQLLQLEDFSEGVFTHIWINRDVREVFSDLTESKRVADLAETLRIEPQTEELDRYVLRRLNEKPGTTSASTGAITRQVIELTREYGRLWNVAYLREIREIVDRNNIHLAYVTEPTSRQVYLIYDMANSILIVNLVGHEDGAVILNRRNAAAEDVTTFVRKRQAFLRLDRWLPPGSTPRRPSSGAKAAPSPRSS